MADTSNQKGLSRDDSQALCERILNMSSADHVRLNITSGWRGYTRVATNKITSAGGSNDTSIRITSVFGKRVASVTTNRLEDALLKDAVRRSEALARLAPENPEYLSELGPQDYAEVNGYYGSTGDMEPVARAEAAALGIRKAQDEGFVAAGFMDVRAGTSAVATSSGLYAHHASTGVASTLTVRAPDGSSSGWAGDEAADWQHIENLRVAQDASRKCADWNGKTMLDPGKYTVVLEPTAVGMLMSRMRGVFNARQADEGRSYFSNPDGGTRIGEKLFDERVSFRSDPTSRDSEASPFTGAGEANKARTWVENGVLKNLAYSRYWAQQKDRPPLPGPSNFLMSGGDDSLDDMIASTERGVLLTRFWYIRGLNPRTISHTGLTRDGTFLIENGKISRPVNNFRFNQSLVELLQNIEMIGRPVRVAATENSSVGSPIVVPPLKVRDFNLASVSDAI